MAPSYTVDASVRRLLRASLERVVGVERVMVDEEGGSILVLGGMDLDRELVRTAAHEALASAGVESAEVPVEFVLRGDSPPRRRVRFVGVERCGEDDGGVRVRVTLEWQGSEHTGDAVGERGVFIERRTAAIATLEALDRIVPERLGLRLAGIKVQRAFDTDILVVALYQPGPPPRRFIGAVLVADDPLHAAAIATLSAVNRLLGNFIEASD